jgi:excinuclease ABC subunit B
VIVASVSCIYGLGSPEWYRELSVRVRKGERVSRDSLLRSLAAIQYHRDNYAFARGSFRVRGDVIEIFPAYEEQKAIRIELFGDSVEGIFEVDPLRGEVLGEPDEIAIYPTSHYVTPGDQLQRACATIEQELEVLIPDLKARGKLLEAQRLEQRTHHDLEMLRATGVCNGIENYSRHLDGRVPGQPRPRCCTTSPRTS